MNYGEIIIPGNSKRSPNVNLYMSPFLTNNEISGPNMTIALAREITNLKKRNLPTDNINSRDYRGNRIFE